MGETYREAYDFGFRDGALAGRNDRREGRPFDLANKKEFQNADRGFESNRHDREVYMVAYRRGFEDGYENGFGLQPETDAPPPGASPAGDAASPDKTPGGPPSPPAPNSPPNPWKPNTRRLQNGTAPAGVEIRVELRDPLSTRYNERGDPFRSRVVQDVTVNGALLIPRGAEAVGSISYLKRAGRIRGRATINLRFEELRMPDGRSFPLEAMVVGVESQSDEEVEDSEGAIVAQGGKASDAKTVGTTSGIGALIGVIAGGKRGAGAGAAAGAVAGLANVLVTRGRDVELEPRTQLTIRLTQPLTLSDRTP